MYHYCQSEYESVFVLYSNWNEGLTFKGIIKYNTIHTIYKIYTIYTIYTYNTIHTCTYSISTVEPQRLGYRGHFSS